MASETLHEPQELLSTPTKDMHRAIVSLMEELEAVDWYQQRAEACQSEELRAVLIHNKNEEIEHAMMVLEWMRRNSPEWDKNIRTYLLREEPIVEIEAADEEKGTVTASPGAGRGLGTGSLKEG
jgi:uncharacterized protein